MNFEIQIAIDKTPFYVKGVFKKGNAFTNEKGIMENEPDSIDVEDILVSGISIYEHLNEDTKKQIFVSTLDTMRG